MYLSKLEVVGFKSFANKVHLKFDSGITAIVGPNGCGKTNVVDAIRWALGEQRPSTLRSDKMEDVIFNGTKKRKPIGMADVSLTIENTKGILPTEYSEVTVTRRVYRSGESEYFLNKTLCRLKDIKDLFMDTGMGSDAYSVIELKMVETILSDRTDERRRLFEEAAGVTKYKHRRKEAYHKLETVQQDLVRVNDVVKEVQKAVNSLERQAQKAEKYNEFSQRLRALEVDLLEREYAALIGNIEPMKKDLNTARSEKERIDMELTSKETLLDILRKELSELEARLTDAQSDLTEQQQKLNAVQQRQISSSERKKSLGLSIERYEKDKVELRRQEEELQARSKELRASVEQAHEKVDAAERHYADKKAELDAFTIQVDAKKGEVKKLQDLIMGLLNEISLKRQEHERTKARVENIHGRIDFSNEENEIYKNEVGTNSELVNQLSAEDRALRKQFAEAEVRVHQMEQAKITLEKEIESSRNQEFETRGLLDRRQARLEFLKGLVESYDGFSEGAKFLITNDEWKAHVQTTVADAFTTEARFRIAIESALGEMASFIVVKNIDEAYRGIEVLKKNQKGKATFICLDRIPPLTRQRLPVTGEGVIGWAKEVVSCDPAFSNLSEYVFDNTVLVNDVRSALPMVNGQPLLKCVTLDGEIVTGQGVLKGGSAHTDDGGMIGKKSQITELEGETASLEESLAKIRREIAGKERALAAIEIKTLSEAAKRIEQQMTSVEMRIAQIEFEKKRINENMARNTSENSKLAVEADDLQKEIDLLLPEIARLEKEKSTGEQNSGAAASELETMEVLWTEYSEVTNTAHVALVNLQNEEKNIARELEYTRETIENITSTLAQRDRDIAEAKVEIERLTADLRDTESEINGLNSGLQAMVERRKGVDSEYNVKRNQMHEIELKIKDERRLHDDSLGVTHELEIKLSELSLRAENLVTRAREEYGFLLEVKQYADAGDFNIETVRGEVQTLKEKITALGPVNFAAFDEFKGEKERLEFITTQRNDLVDAEKTLLSTIDEINTTAQKTFGDTFSKIRDNFIATFKGLFDEGDECDLRLEEDVDPLEARIEIIAKPRGKRPTSIDLLSGGEKTLTAIALLFAIYLVKPSPFCILDEVDAPLDDSNIDRFSRILRKFSDNTQFIVVTHNKRTMEAANAMYGVTMEEEGVSKLVSVRFNENAVAQN
ncbi:MAG TPA: chromosome segregation protein SMC [Bacteroidota bacterium]|nr:chromosome segregation protein SMC [Bacteroidota bacterium]